MINYPIELRRGYAFTFGIRFTTDADLTGADITWVLADGPFSGAQLRILKTGLPVVRADPSSPWLITVSITDADTVNIPPGDYYHECRVFPTASPSHCPASGTATLLDSPIPPLAA